MDFYHVLDEVEKGLAVNPFAAKQDDNYVGGLVSIDYLNKHYGQYDEADEMISATPFEGYKKYFSWLKEKAILN